MVQGSSVVACRGGEDGAQHSAVDVLADGRPVGRDPGERLLCCGDVARARMEPGDGAGGVPGGGIVESRQNLVGMAQVTHTAQHLGLHEQHPVGEGGRNRPAQFPGRGGQFPERADMVMGLQAAHRGQRGGRERTCGSGAMSSIAATFCSQRSASSGSPRSRATQASAR